MKRLPPLTAASLLLMLAACTVPELSDLEQDKPRTCDAAHPCRPGYACEAGVCRPGEGPSTGLPDAGPTDPGAVCTPACAAHEACTSTGCVGRFTLAIVSPAEGTLWSGAPMTVEARLVPNPALAAAPEYPPSLSFQVTRANGASGGTLGAVTASGGTYRVQWTPSEGEDDFVLTAAYPSEGGPTHSVRLSVDTVAPTFTVTVPSAPPPPSTSPGDLFVYADPEPGWATAWRRDQEVPVEVRVRDRNAQPEGVTVALHGTDGQLAPAVNLTPFTKDCAAGLLCGVATLKLWEPNFPAFRSALRIHVRARDRAGHQTESSDAWISDPTNPGPIPEHVVNVTRWKWSLDAKGTLYTTPAIGERGTVYFGTQNRNLSDGSVSSGSLFAVTPEGKKKWEKALGGVYSSPTVGAPVGGSEFVYAAVNEPSMLGNKKVSLYAVDGESGTVRHACTASTTSEESLGSMGLMRTADGSGTTETALVVDDNGTNARVRAIRPLAQVDPCIAYSQATAPMPQANLVIEGDTFTFATEQKTIARYRFPSSTPVWTAGSSTSYPPTYTLALNAGSLFGAGEFGLIEQSTTGSSFPTLLEGTMGLSLRGVVIGREASGPTILFTGLDTTGQTIVGRHSQGTTSTVKTNGPDSTLTQTPVLGRGGQLYDATSYASIAAYKSDTLGRQWFTQLKLMVTGSPAMDCTRDTSGTQLPGRPGILYVPAYNELRAVIVDSPSLDPNAPWPKYQHDARNTGDPTTPVTNCQ